MEYLVRETYLKRMRAELNDTRVVKVITGMRRSGKSTLMKMYVEELKSSGISPDDILFINFDDFENQSIRTSEVLNTILSEFASCNRTVYVFLDEIQNVAGWEMSVAGLINSGNCDTYITGSNSDMLSSQLATHLSGRHTEIRVFPLSFAEFCEFHGFSDRDAAFLLYLKYGGIPSVDPNRNPEYTTDYLTGVYNTVVNKDVIRHLEVRDALKVEDIAKFLFSNIGNITNKNTISKATGLSASTVDAYLKAMEEAFLFIPCDRYNMIGKKLLKSNRKYYATDLGLRNSVSGFIVGTDISRPVENIVFIELLRRGYTVRIGSYRDSEIDFMALRDNRIEYFQVCMTMLSHETRKRELNALTRPKDNYEKTVLTLDRIGLGNENGILVRNLVDWLTVTDRNRSIKCDAATD